MAKGKGSESEDGKKSIEEALRAVSMRAAVDALAFKRRVQVLRDAFDGTVLQGADGSAVSRASRRRPGEVLYEAVKLQLQIANELMDFGQSQVDFWLDRAQRVSAASLPKDQRPALRLAATCAAGATVTWRVFVFNAAHEPRAVALKGKWKKGPWAGGAAPAWACAIEDAPFVVPARAERELVFTHPVDGSFKTGETYVAKVKVQMCGGKKSTTPTLRAGKLELALTVEG